jgi:putative transcriptional regulator
MMRESVKKSIAETVQGLLDAGLPVTFTQRELVELGVVVPPVEIDPCQVQRIRKATGWSQTVFAKVFDVSPNAIRQWEQGVRHPAGPARVLLELLERDPRLLDYRIGGRLNRTKKGSQRAAK